ncbi:MAG: hypothetical protein MJ252_03135 [archaeon]|nr:hypothetical protein [archaeon]
MESKPQSEIPLEDLSLVGSLKFKEIGKPLLELSDECTLSIITQSEISYRYLIYLENSEAEKSGPKAWPNLSFSVCPECNFKVFSCGNYFLMWEKDCCFYIFEILTDDKNKANLEPFLDYLRECISSNHFKSPIKLIKKDPYKYSTITPLKDMKDINQYLEDNYQNYKRNPVVKRKDPEVDALADKLFAIELQTKKVEEVINTSTAKKICSFKGEFFIYNPETENLSKYMPGKNFISIYLTAPFEYKIIVEAEGIAFACEKLNADSRTAINESDLNFMWLATLPGMNCVTALCFKMENKEELNQLRVAVNKALYETTAETSFDKLDQGSKDNLERLDKIEEESEEDKSHDTDSDFDQKYQEKKTERVNKFTNQCFIRDRTFSIMSDNSINVFKPSSDSDDLSLDTTIPAVKEYHGNDLCFSKGQLNNQETTLLLLDKNNNKSVYEYDLEKGKIVNEWNCKVKGDDSVILGITPQSKKDQITPNQCFYGFDKKNIFIIDGRMKGIDKSNGKWTVYTTNNNHTCIASNGYGNFATGSYKGDIRLYEDIGQYAKTLLKGYGDPIIGIDITFDGKYVLATCKKYLLFVCTVSKRDDSLTGFVTHIKGEAPPLRTLKLKPTDITKYHLEGLDFTPAKFNVGDGEEENIITSLGDYIIVWNLNKIKKGLYFSYKIRKVSQIVLENQYKFNKDQVIVTMPHTIRVQNQKKI